MEHLLRECMHYLQLFWIRLGEILMQYLNSTSQEYIPRADLSQLNITYKDPHPSLLLHMQNILTRSAFLILTQDIKCDIIYIPTNDLPPSARQGTSSQRLMAHLDSTFR
jgi:hypothetical protein